MYSIFSSHKKIIASFIALLLTLLLAVQPLPFAVAQEVPGDPPPEEVIEEPGEEIVEEPIQEDGNDGNDGEDAGDGNDGESGDPEPEGPQPGADGENTEDEEPGEEGENETGGEEENGTGEEETTIDTGDAESQGSIENFVDLTILKTLAEKAGIDLPPLVLSYIYYDYEEGKYKTSDPDRQDELDEALEDGLLDPYEYLQIVTPEEDTTASTTNDAIVENEAEVNAETGDNSASNNENVTINTGDATAVANVLNVVNTNIFDSEGFFLFLDNLSEDGVQGTLDFREFDFFNPDSVSEETDARESAGENPITAICPTCGGAGDLTINTGQDASITNDIVVRSGTGANLGLNNSGDTTINTGDAYAAANTINLANTNIVDSNYLLLTFNNFGDYNNDIVFPGAEEFLELFQTGGQTTPSEVHIDNTNTTGVDNNTDVTGVTGDNVATGGDITTGDANASNNTLNQLNSNLFGGSSFSILVKVHGEWDGDVVGIPDGMTWRETPEGIELIYDSEGGSCDGTGPCGGYDAIDVTTNNSTQIANNISVMALTGENKIEGNGGEAEINTGDAFAAANTINVANTNVIGKNWMMAVVNIFGDWNGNLSFGQPNLWVGAKASIDGHAEPGESFAYEYTVMNTGDAPATNVCLRNRFNHNLVNLQILTPTTDREVARGDVEYCIGTVNPGEIREITRQARIAEHLGYGTTYIENDIEVQGGGEETNMEDNFEAVTFDVTINPPSNSSTGGTKIIYTPSPKLTISKVNASPFFVRASSTVNYRVIIENKGAGPAYDAVLIDTLYNDDGDKIYEEHWNLGEIYAGEYIEVFYTTFFNDATEEGVYRNEARVEALGGYHTFKYGWDATTETVESSVKVVPNPQSQNKEQEVEILEETKEVVETLPEVNDEEESGVAPEPIVIALIEEPQIEIVYGSYHGPLYYEPRSSSQSTFSFGGALHDHPLFTQHPVHIFSLGEYVGHPLFTAHPVFIQHSFFSKDEDPVAAFPWLNDLTAGPTFIKFLSLPFGKVSIETKEEQNTEKSNNTLALLALSMFVLRKPVYRSMDLKDRG